MTITSLWRFISGTLMSKLKKPTATQHITAWWSMKVNTFEERVHYWWLVCRNEEHCSPLYLQLSHS